MKCSSCQNIEDKSGNYLYEHFGVSSYISLSKEEEIRYFNEYASGSQKAYNFLVSNNLPLVFSIVQKYRSYKIEFDDLFQIGNIGLIRAIKTFDVDKGYRFSTYATPTIGNYLSKSISNRYDIHIPVNRCGQLSTLVKAIEELKNRYGRDLSIDEIQNILSISDNDIVYLTMLLNLHISIDVCCGNGLTIVNIIPSNDISVEDRVEDASFFIALKHMMKERLR